MRLELDLEFPSDDSPPIAPSGRMEPDRYLAFIEFQQQVLRENGQVQRALSMRTEPVSEAFSLELARS